MTLSPLSPIAINMRPAQRQWRNRDGNGHPALHPGTESRLRRDAPDDLPPPRSRCTPHHTGEPSECMLSKHHLLSQNWVRSVTVKASRRRNGYAPLRQNSAAIRTSRRHHADFPAAGHPITQKQVRFFAIQAARRPQKRVRRDISDSPILSQKWVRLSPPLQPSPLGVWYPMPPNTQKWVRAPQE